MKCCDPDIKLYCPGWENCPYGGAAEDDDEPEDDGQPDEMQE